MTPLCFPLAAAAQGLGSEPRTWPCCLVVSSRISGPNRHALPCVDSPHLQPWVWEAMCRPHSTDQWPRTPHSKPPRAGNSKVRCSDLREVPSFSRGECAPMHHPLSSLPPGAASLLSTPFLGAFPPSRAFLLFMSTRGSGRPGLGQAEAAGPSAPRQLLSPAAPSETPACAPMPPALPGTRCALFWGCRAKRGTRRTAQGPCQVPCGLGCRDSGRLSQEPARWRT